MRVLREARALGAVQLGLSGGEPLLRDDLEVIVAEAHALGFYINLITSGVGLTETRIAALKEAGLDHIQLSFQDSTREMNDFLSSTRTFELKSQSRGADQAVRLSDGAERACCTGSTSITSSEILDMAERMGAEYVELANTQYYGWAWHNREQLLPSRAQVERAEAVTNALPRARGRAHAGVLRRAGLLREPPEGLHERPGLGVPHGDARRHRAAVPRGAHAAGPDVPERRDEPASNGSGATRRPSTASAAMRG